jgi:hypothetical protein
VRKEKNVAACSRPSQNRVIYAARRTACSSSLSPTFNAKIATNLAPLLCKLANYLFSSFRNKKKEKPVLDCEAKKRCSSLFEAVTKQRQICAARRTGVRCRQPSMQRSPLFWPLCSANWLLCAQSFNPKLNQITKSKTKPQEKKSPNKHERIYPIGSPAERTTPNQSRP